MFEVAAFKSFGNHKGVDNVIFVQVFCKFLLYSKLQFYQEKLLAHLEQISEVIREYTGLPKINKVNHYLEEILRVILDRVFYDLLRRVCLLLKFYKTFEILRLAQHNLRVAFNLSPVSEYENEISCRFSRFIKLALYPALMIRKVNRHYFLISLLH